MSQTVPRLVLCPVEPDAPAHETEQLVSLLKTAGLAGEKLALPGMEERYQAGDAFLQQIIFLGCSPAVDFEPDEPGSEKFCHLRISSGEPLQFISGEHSTQARCPACRHLEKDWQALIRQWQSEPHGTLYTCPECAGQTPPEQMNWRKTAGFARQYIEIFNVFPNEAVPADGLLNTLEKQTGIKWKYFYVR